MTPEQLQAIRERAEKAQHYLLPMVSRQDAVDLLSYVEELEKKLELIKEEAKHVVWERDLND